MEREREREKKNQSQKIGKSPKAQTTQDFRKISTANEGGEKINSQDQRERKLKSMCLENLRNSAEQRAEFFLYSDTGFQMKRRYKAWIFFFRKANITCSRSIGLGAITGLRWSHIHRPWCIGLNPCLYLSSPICYMLYSCIQS